ncbi:MAG: hypothetical protein U9N45_04525, partial [Gemmatimonadota bacterium]|nr:hypothetical protein [Gemmatimonadota bacterium]
MARKKDKEKQSASRWRKFFHLWHRTPFSAMLRFTLLAVILAAAAVAGIYYSLKDEIHMALDRWVDNQTYRLFGPEATFTEMEMPTLGHFIFHDFQIADPYDKNISFIRAGRVEVWFDPLYIVRRGINLARVEIHQARIHLHREHGTGDINITDIFKFTGDPGGSGPRVRLRRFVLDSCLVYLEDLSDQPIENRIHRMEGTFTRI